MNIMRLIFNWLVFLTLPIWGGILMFIVICAEIIFEGEYSDSLGHGKIFIWDDIDED